jgi:hypothetical protein
MVTASRLHGAGRRMQNSGSLKIRGKTDKIETKKLDI